MLSERKRRPKNDTPPAQKRHRTDPSSSNCGILDAIPYDIGKRIAQHVCAKQEPHFQYYGRGIPPAIALALTSKQQSLIVSDVIRRILVMHNCSTPEVVSCWISSLNWITELQVLSKPSPEIVLTALAHADVRLQKLYLHFVDVDLSSNIIHYLTELRELDITIGKGSARFNFLVKAFSKQHLRKLKIYTMPDSRSNLPCIVDKLGFPSVECFADELRTACYNLEELSLTCNCSTDCCPITTFDVTKLPHLRSLSLHTLAPFPDSVVTSLRSVESLSIAGSNADCWTDWVECVCNIQ